LQYLEFIFYGLIQGLTEFIPISSTAHLKVLSLLFGIDDPGPSLSAIIQIGSVFALFCYFRNDIFKFNKQKSNTILNSFLFNKIVKSIFIGTIPIVFLGGIIKLFIPDFFDNILRSNLSIAIISILMAIYMYFADVSRNKFINIRNHNYLDSLLIGFSQSFSIIPGVSRSGVTISTALLSGWERRDAAKYSFLLGIPAISLAAIVELIFSINQISDFKLYPLLVGLITAFLSSLLSIKFFLNFLSSNGLKLFIYYRFIFGLLILFNL
tara:strand:- start:742 stop:1542 length:801 start_codon:yes stop_codon:yes gene_type:complete